MDPIISVKYAGITKLQLKAYSHQTEAKAKAK